MDWGLFDKNANENKFLREEIVYSSTVSLGCIKFEATTKMTMSFPSIVFLLLCYNRRLHSSLYMGVGVLLNRIQVCQWRYNDIDRCATGSVQVRFFRIANHFWIEK